MNKQELIAEAAKRTGYTKQEVGHIVDAVIGVTTDELAKGAGHDLRLVGFGTFSVQERSAREGKNPQTGEAITVEATNVAKFKPGSALKEAVAASYKPKKKGGRKKK